MDYTEAELEGVRKFGQELLEMARGKRTVPELMRRVPYVSMGDIAYEIERRTTGDTAEAVLQRHRAANQARWEQIKQAMPEPVV